MPQVLVIDDDRAVRDGLELALRRQGYGVHVAMTGEEGLPVLRSSPCDVVVLDLMLPGLDGFEVRRRLRVSGPVPIIMLTARGDDLDIVAGLAAGADDYVVKPVEPGCWTYGSGRCCAASTVSPPIAASSGIWCSIGPA